MSGLTGQVGRYIDLDLDFNLNPFTKDVSKKVDVEAVKRSVRNIVLTNKYEKPFHPEIHSGVRGLLFEPVSFITIQELKSRIERVIRDYEPRVNELDVQVTSNIDANAFDVTVAFTVRNILEAISLNITLERLR